MRSVSRPPSVTIGRPASCGSRAAQDKDIAVTLPSVRIRLFGLSVPDRPAPSVITLSDVLLLEPSRRRPMTSDSIRGSSDRSILILTSLADWPKHGYALIKDIEGFAGVKLGAGTLYSALAKLEQAGLVEALPAEERRRPYRITPAGQEFLYARLPESARIAEVGLQRIAVASS